jgi:hypothetical protein
MAYILVGVTDDEEGEVHRQEETPRHQHCYEHRDILIFGLRHSVVRLDDQVPWEWDPASMTNLPKIGNSTTQDLQKSIGPVIQLFWSGIHVHAEAMRHRYGEGNAGPTHISKVMWTLRPWKPRPRELCLIHRIKDDYQDILETPRCESWIPIYLAI